MHSVRRPRAFALARQTDSGKTLPDVSVVERMALSRAVAGPGPIAGRIRLDARRAGNMALVPCNSVTGPSHGKRCVQPQGDDKRERGQAKGGREKRATAHERAPDR